MTLTLSTADTSLELPLRTASPEDARLPPFAAPEGPGVRDAGGRPGLDYAEQRAALQTGGSQGQIYDAAGTDIEKDVTAGRKVVLSAFSAAARDRLPHRPDENRRRA